VTDRQILVAVHPVADDHATLPVIGSDAQKLLKLKPKKDDGDDFGNGGDASVKSQRGVSEHSQRNRNESGLSLCNRVSLSGGLAVDETNGLPEVTYGFCRSAITIHFRRWRFCIVRANDPSAPSFPPIVHRTT
jgi:hypothetical protein